MMSLRLSFAPKVVLAMVLILAVFVGEADRADGLWVGPTGASCYIDEDVIEVGEDATLTTDGIDAGYFETHWTITSAGSGSAPTPPDPTTGTVTLTFSDKGEYDWDCTIHDDKWDDDDDVDDEEPYDDFGTLVVVAAGSVSGPDKGCAEDGLTFTVETDPPGYAADVSIDWEVDGGNIVDQGDDYVKVEWTTGGSKTVEAKIGTSTSPGHTVEITEITALNVDKERAKVGTSDAVFDFTAAVTGPVDDLEWELSGPSSVDISSCNGSDNCNVDLTAEDKGEYTITVKCGPNHEKTKDITVVGLDDASANGAGPFCVESDIEFTGTTEPAGHEDLIEWEGGENPATGSGQMFTTQYTTEGMKTVTAKVGTDEEDIDVEVVDDLTIIPGDGSTCADGDPIQFEAWSCQGGTGTPQNVTSSATWTTSLTSASIGSNGELTPGSNAEQGTVTADWNGLTDDANATVDKITSVAGPGRACVDQEVTFTVNFQFGMGGDVTWDVDGGTIINESDQDVTVKWLAGDAGSKTVKAECGSGSASTPIEVTEITALDVDKERACKGPTAQFTFTATITGPPDDLEWEVTSGPSSVDVSSCNGNSTCNADFTGADPGNYTVKVKCGPSNEFTKDIRVVGVKMVKVNTSTSVTDNYCVNKDIEFEAESEPPGDEDLLEWEGGENPANGTGQMFTTQFSNEGSKTVKAKCGTSEKDKQIMLIDELTVIPDDKEFCINESPFNYTARACKDGQVQDVTTEVTWTNNGPGSMSSNQFTPGATSGEGTIKAELGPNNDEADVTVDEIRIVTATSSVGGQTGYCFGEEVTFTAIMKHSSSHPVTWPDVDGGTIVDQTNHTITLTWNTAGSKTVQAECGTDLELKTITVTQIEKIDGPCVVGKGATKTYTAQMDPPVTGVTIEWFVDGASSGSGPTFSFTAPSTVGMKKIKAKCGDNEIEIDVLVADDCSGDVTFDPMSVAFPKISEGTGGMSACEAGKTGPREVSVDIDVCFDPATEEWRPIVRGITSKIRNDFRLPPGYQEPNPGPGGNTTQANYCEQATQLQNLCGPCPGSQWCVLDAAEAHENVHVEDWKTSFRSHVAQLESKIEDIRIPATAPDCDKAAAISRIKAKSEYTDAITEARTNARADWISISAHPASDPNTDAAAHGAIDPIIQNICNFAITNGWEEDVNGNNILDPGEDADGDGHLDRCDACH